MVAVDFADPYARYRRMRAEDPVHFAPKIQSWLIFRYADILAALRDPRLSSRIGATFFARLAPEQRARMRDFERMLALWVLFRDPPDHARLRGIITRALSPRIVAALAPRIESLVTELLDAAEARGDLDVIRDVGMPLPVLVIAELLGVPRESRDQIKQWADELAEFLDSREKARRAAEKAQTAFLALGDYLGEIAEERRRAPQDDLMSALVAPADGASSVVDADEITAIGSMLLFAGHETTTNLIGNGALALLRHPDERARFVAEPALAEHAVEELLRYDSPVQSVWRVAAEDFELAGKRIRTGEMVFPIVGSANRDEACFPDPDRLDLGRRDVRHLSFGHGTHFCPGAALSRLEGRIALRTLFTRYPALRLAGGELKWLDHGSLRGPTSLPVAT